MRRNEKPSTKRQKWKEKCTHKRLETTVRQTEKCKTLMERHKQRQRLRKTASGANERQM